MTTKKTMYLLVIENDILRREKSTSVLGVFDDVPMATEAAEYEKRQMLERRKKYPSLREIKGVTVSFHIYETRLNCERDMPYAWKVFAARMNQRENKKMVWECPEKYGLTIFSWNKKQ